MRDVIAFKRGCSTIFELEDQRLGLQLALYYALPIENLKLALDVEKVYRWSDIEAFTSDTDETRFLARIVFEF